MVTGSWRQVGKASDDGTGVACSVHDGEVAAGTSAEADFVTDDSDRKALRMADPVRVLATSPPACARIHECGLELVRRLAHKPYEVAVLEKAKLDALRGAVGEAGMAGHVDAPVEVVVRVLWCYVPTAGDDGGVGLALRSCDEEAKSE